MDVLTAVEHWALAEPDRLAAAAAESSLTYAGLAAGARAVAASLAARHLEPGAPVVVRGHKEPEMLLGFLGCLMAGHPYVPVDDGVPDERVGRIAAQARAPLTLTAAEIASFAREPVRSDPGPPVRRSSDDVQYIMFTSGSTGQPKGVPITIGNLDQFYRWMLGEQRFTPAGERFLDQAVYSFDLSVMAVHLSLVTGGTLVPVTRDDVADFARLFRTLATSSLTVWVSTPTFAQLCLVERRFDATMLPGLGRFLFCGETLPPDVARALLGRFPDAEIWNTYGPTEATVATTSVRVDRALLDRYPTLPIGRAAPGSQVVIVNDDLAPVADGEQGEILIAGPNVSPGYLHAPELTERAFVRWNGQPAYRTGDQGHVEDGLLFFDGRRDEQIKLHGHRIELGDVEAALRALPGVVGAAVVVMRKEGIADSLTGFVVLQSGADGTASDARSLRTQLASRIPGYMIPRRIHCLDSLPMTPNGKLDRRRLADLPR